MLSKSKDYKKNILASFIQCHFHQNVVQYLNLKFLMQNKYDLTESPKVKQFKSITQTNYDIFTVFTLYVTLATVNAQEPKQYPWLNLN